MISRITGCILRIGETSIELAVGDLCYELLTPAATIARLSDRAAESNTFFTLQQFEGNIAVGSLTPRLYGFLSPEDRDFCELLTRIRGISLRKALRIMSLPTGEIAAAIQRGDERFLTALPEVGKKTAAQMVGELREAAVRFAAAPQRRASAPIQTLTDVQQVAVQVLIGWGDKPADAQHWVGLAVEREPTLTEPEAIIAAAYRIRAGRR